MPKLEISVSCVFAGTETHSSETNRNAKWLLGVAVNLGSDNCRNQIGEAIEQLGIAQARREIPAFVKVPELLAVWSREFFPDTVGRIRCQ